MLRSKQLRPLAGLSALSCARCLPWGGLVGFSCFQSFQALVQCSALVFCVFCLVLFSSFFSSGGKAPPPSQWNCILDITHCPETIRVLILVSAGSVCG